MLLKNVNKRLKYYTDYDDLTGYYYCKCHRHRYPYISVQERI